MGEWTTKKKMTLGACILAFVAINLISLFTSFIGLKWEQLNRGSPMGRTRLKVLIPEGCKNHNFCPANMHCDMDFDYTYWRTCEYNEAVGFMRKPPFFDDNERDVWTGPKFRGSVWEFAIGEIIWKGTYAISGGRLAQYSWQTLARVIKNNDKFVWNSTARALFLLCGVSTWLPWWNLIFIANSFNWDPHNTMMDYGFWQLILPVEDFFIEFLRYEMPVAWIDLVLKTVNMSKSSTKSFIVIKTIVYMWLCTFLFVLRHFNLSKDQKRAYSPIKNWVDIFFLCVPGMVLARLLCKNMKDTTNPNWKVAKIINRTWQTALAGYVVRTFIYLPMYVRHNWSWFRQDQYFATSWYMLWKCNDLAVFYMYLHYCLYGFRKYLQEYDTEYVSQFFGFSTVGIQSRVTSSLASSRMSSAMSSTGSSVADVSKASSSASVAEGAKETA